MHASRPPASDSYRIVPVTAREAMPHVRRLFVEYAQWLAVDLCFQGFDQELADLPGTYAPPRGRILLAVATDSASLSVEQIADGWDDQHIAGCVALRPIGDDVCEMKRLFVREAHRGQGLGRRLATEIIEVARSIGYRVMRLDTLNTMTTAIALYKSLGFVEIDPYYHNPIACAVYMELPL